MSWLLYKTDASESVLSKFQVLAKGALEDPLYAAMKRQPRVPGQRAVTWELRAADLLRSLGHEGERTWFIIDMKPKQRDNVSLYRLTHIWGHSYADWTPIALQLRTIFVDRWSDDSEAFKQRFRIPRNGDIVHEFLYLQGGFARSNWVWGRVGSVNGALLWPDAFNHFVKCIAPFTQS